MKEFENILLTEGEWKGYPSIYPFLNVIWKYSDMLTKLKDINIFIETGTHNGSNVKEFSKYFKNVYTVELYPKNFMDGYKLIKIECPNIEFFSGESAQFLKEVLEKINENSVILLDAHNASSCPLIEELDAIHKYSTKNDNIIIIDDTNFFGNWGWPKKEEVEKKILEINPNYSMTYTPLGNGILLIY